MRRHKLRAAITVVILAAICALLSRQRPRSALELRLRPDGESVRLALRNHSAEPAAFYNSLRGQPGDARPGVTTIRLRDASGHVLLNDECSEDGFWTRDLTLTKRVPTVLDSLPPGAELAGSVELASLLEGYPDPALLARAQDVQVKTVIFLDLGVVEGTSGWFALPRGLKRP
jgi:hypothetical protein